MKNKEQFSRLCVTDLPLYQISVNSDFVRDQSQNKFSRFFSVHWANLSLAYYFAVILLQQGY